MSKDEKDNGKEYTFIKEQILPRKRSRAKKMCISFSATVLLAVVFGIVARIAFIVSEPFVNRLLGIDTNKKQVVFNSSDEGSPKGQAFAGVEDETASKTLEGTENLETEDKNSEGLEEGIENTTVNKNYYYEEKVAADIDDFTNMYVDLKKLAVSCSESLVSITCVEEDVDVLENPYEKQTKIPGLVVGNNGIQFLILVSYDEIKDASYLRATFSENMVVHADLEEYDENTGLAIVSVLLSKLSSSVIEDTKVATLGESYLLTNGTPVIAIGSPNGINESFDFGMVTNVMQPVYLTDLKLDLFYTNILISETGLGYVVDLDGAVVGIITSRYWELSKEPIHPVIGISRVRSLIEKMVNGKARASLGIVAQDMSADALMDAGINYGIYVSSVVTKSPAYHAGLQSGDIITSIDQRAVGGLYSFVNIIDDLTYKSEVMVSIIRYSHGEPKEIVLEMTVDKVN